MSTNNIWLIFYKIKILNYIYNFNGFHFCSLDYKDNNMTNMLYKVNSRLYYNTGRITTDESGVNTYSTIVFVSGGLMI